MRNLVWSGSFYENSGFGSVAREYVYWMQESGRFDVKINPVSYSLIDGKKYLEESEINYFQNLEFTKKECNKYYDRIFVNHITPDIAYIIDKFKNNVLYTTWETDRIQDKAVERCNNFDLILTPSEFSKFAFLNAGVNKPIEVIHHICILKKLNENKQLEELTKNKFTFLSIFEWSLRKGYDILIESFIETFKNDPDVLLIIKTNSFTNISQLKGEVVSYIKSVKKDLKYPSIYPICDFWKTNNLNSLYKYANCYVSVARGEAFSLTLANSLINGLLCIAPSKGGHTEFLNDKNAILIPSEYADIINLEKERSHYKGQKWIEVNKHYLMEALKAVKEEWSNPDEEQILTLKQESEKVQKQLSPEVILNKFEDIFKKYCN